MSRLKNSLQIHLNGELIYDREVDSEGPSQFAFYRDSLSQSIQIRSVRVSGDWPDELPEDFRQSPTRSMREDR